MKQTLLSSLVLGPALLLAALLIPATAAASGPIASTACTGTGTVTCNLWAKTGTLALPTGTSPASVPIWGFTDSSTGSATVPGPTLVVNQDDVVTVNLTNDLAVPTGLAFDGVAMIPDLTPVAAGATRAYHFTASAPGTYLYEAGLIPSTQYQVAMGMYGVLVVRPATVGQAYAEADSAYTDEALVVLGDIDPALNTAADPSLFDLRDFAPKIFLINGKASADTDPITTLAGTTVLLRYANAGLQTHSMSLLGASQKVIATDGSHRTYSYPVTAETMAPGQTSDAIVFIDSAAPAGARYPLYDGAFNFNNGNSHTLGGMLTYISVGGTGGSLDTVGPLTSNVARTPTGKISGSTAVTVTATVSDIASGGSNVDAAEYFIDTTGAVGTGAAMTGPFGSPTVAVTGTITSTAVGALSTGSHTIYVRGRDVAGNWGALASITLDVDNTGPLTTAATLTPNPSNGSVNVALSATGDDRSTGASNIRAAEYYIDSTAGTGTAMTLNKPADSAQIVSLSASITVNSLSEGSHTVSLRSEDAAGNWGAFSTITLKVDKTGPALVTVTAAPSATNGTQGLNSSTPAVRVTATFTDVLGNVSAAEAFIGSLGTTGRGIVFTPTDGSFNSPTETGYADIPLSQINTYPVGNLTISVHAKDSAGNWATTFGTVVILIDKTAPTFTGITVAPTPTNGAPTVTMTVNGANDPPVSGLASLVSGGEYWFGTTVPAPGSGTRFSGLTPSIPVSTLATGTYTIGARVRDGAGNWSANTASTTFVVWANVIFSDGFESPTSLPGRWSSRSTGTTARLNVTTAAALAGTYGLQAQGNNTNYVQFNFGTTAIPAAPTYDARFYFRPNNNASTGNDILSAATSSTFGTPTFRVRYRLDAGQTQVQIQVGTTNTNTNWTNVNSLTNNSIEVIWQALGSTGPTPGTLTLYVNGTLSQTLTSTSTNSVGAVRMGSVTSGGSSTLMYFDAFASKRQTSPLVGP